MNKERALKDLLLSAKGGDQEAVIEIIKRFRPALKKYSRWINNEEAYSDLILWLIKAIQVYPPYWYNEHNSLHH